MMGMNEEMKDGGMMSTKVNIEGSIPDVLKNKEVGDECMMQMRGKVMSKDMQEDGTGGMDIEMMEMKAMGEEKLAKEKYLDMNEEEKDVYDQKKVTAEE